MAIDPNDLPKGAGSAETPSLTDPFGRTANKPGVYVHKASGGKVIVMPDAKSSGQQDALVRLGYEYSGPPPTRVELQQMQQAQFEADEKAGNLKPANSATFGTYNPDLPRHELTSTIVQNDLPGQSGNSDAQTGSTDAAATEKSRADAAEARATALAEELAALKASSIETPDSTDDETDTTGSEEDTETNEKKSEN